MLLDIPLVVCRSYILQSSDFNKHFDLSQSSTNTKYNSIQRQTHHHRNNTTFATMPKKPPKPPTPPDLREARELPADEDQRDAHTYCHDLSCYGSRDDYHWGFQIYRTTYPPACTDFDFDRAIQVLNEYIRYSVFEDLSYDPSSGTITNSYASSAVATDKPERTLWRRLRNDIVQDQQLLDAAPTSKIKGLAKTWITSRGAGVAESSRYRFFLIIDEEVVRNLLQYPMPATLPPRRWQWYSIKFLDIEFRKSLLDHEQNYEGWAWAAASRLLQAWFLCRDMDALEVYTCDDEGRPLQSETGV